MQCQESYLYTSKRNAVLGIPLRDICVTNENVRCVLGVATALHAPRWSKLEVKPMQYTPEKGVRMGRYAAKNGPAKAARLFPQLLDHNLPE